MGFYRSHLGLWVFFLGQKMKYFIHSEKIVRLNGIQNIRASKGRGWCGVYRPNLEVSSFSYQLWQPSSLLSWPHVFWERNGLGLQKEPGFQSSTQMTQTPCKLLHLATSLAKSRQIQAIEPSNAPGSYVASMFILHAPICGGFQTCEVSRSARFGLPYVKVLQPSHNRIDEVSWVWLFVLEDGLFVRLLDFPQYCKNHLRIQRGVRGLHCHDLPLEGRLRKQRLLFKRHSKWYILRRQLKKNHL